MKDNGVIRTSSTGATRDTSLNKMELVKYISSIVIKAYGEYMLKHQIQSDGSKRTGDNWKKGFGETPRDTLDIMIDSMGRHFLDLWLEHDGFDSRDGLDEALGGLLFNVIGYWHETLMQRQNEVETTENSKEIKQTIKYDKKYKQLPSEIAFEDMFTKEGYLKI